MSGAFGQQLRDQDLQALFLTGPGQFIATQLLKQLGSVPQFQKLFGKFTKIGDSQMRWADYNRHDWSLRQLPAINVYEAESEEKTSSNAWLNGAITLQVFWPASFRRSDTSRIDVAFKAAIQNFLESQLAQDMLDELFSVQRAAKVPGLNEFGKMMTWIPNVEGFIEDEAVPVTMISIKYRVDLRAWYRFLEFDDRVKEQPFDRTLSDLTVIGGEYDGIPGTDGSEVEAVVEQEITINP